MKILVDDTASQIADRIRIERAARDWSLSDLADRSGVAKATISKIERGETSPTAAILVRIAGAFDLTLAGLLVRAEGEQGRVVRGADQPVWQDPKSGYVRRQVFGRAGHPVELVSVELPAGARVNLPASSYARIRQVVWVRKGTLSILEGALRHSLGTGDCLGFGPPCDVTFANETSHSCTYVVALSRS